MLFGSDQGPVAAEWSPISIGVPIVEIRRSHDRLISTMGTPILIRPLCIEFGPQGVTVAMIMYISLYTAWINSCIWYKVAVPSLWYTFQVLPMFMNAVYTMWPCVSFPESKYFTQTAWYLVVMNECMNGYWFDWSFQIKTWMYEWIWIWLKFSNQDISSHSRWISHKYKLSFRRIKSIAHKKPGLSHVNIEIS